MVTKNNKLRGHKKRLIRTLKKIVWNYIKIKNKLIYRIDYFIIMFVSGFFHLGKVNCRLLLTISDSFPLRFDDGSVCWVLPLTPSPLPSLTPLTFLLSSLSHCPRGLYCNCFPFTGLPFVFGPNFLCAYFSRPYELGLIRICSNF